jgi:hypothetical protein
MNQRKNGARLLGLLVVAALGVMAFAASAQAVAPGFLINKKPVVGLKATAGAKQVGTGSMLVAGLNFQLRCTAFTVDEGVVESNTLGKGVLLYTGCTTLSITKFPEEIHCHVKEPIKAEGIFLPAELETPKALKDLPAVLVEKIKALITLHLPAAKLGEVPCVLPLDNTVTGEVCLKIDNNDTVEPLVLAGIDPTSGEAITCLHRPTLEALTEGLNAKGEGFKDVLKYGAQTAVLDGTAHLFLTGEPPLGHKGLTFGVSLY